jgi:HEPN domain-containing protein
MKKKIELFRDWIKRAHSNFARAKAGKITDDILYEDICFDCQQCAEKALKALLIYLDVEFPKTHSIGKLLKLVEDKGIFVSEDIKESITLTSYAVDTRYPFVVKSR